MRNVVADSANIIFGTNVSPDLNGEVDITIIATGFDKTDENERAQTIAKGNPKQALDMLMGVNREADETVQQVKTAPQASRPADDDRRNSNENTPSFMKKMIGGNRNS